ncbi:DUF2062 domain-containing protein [Candidatus Berkiella cookevillensis]|uniref:DUF2062 domain-containing protein n=1 Tax=Candidatus Berkiella cookevillensis TaxID=437022 RepID=A0A0Q9YFP6_9GAMM|nr:DUF2062 domain-containing protein [Candidatus Berkiella cookevillensis]MCS5708986.1 DUF2062 domain-containing protein [Candidatus Berkiella cookevillensis]
MPKKLLKKFIPHHKIKDHKHLKMFGSLLHNPNLWSLNRYSVSTAFSIGLFCAMIPMPFQMIPAAACAIVARANLPISIALVWLTNPITMPPVFYFAFKVGAYVLGREARGFQFDASVEWFASGLASIWQPFLLGCFICGSVLAISSNILIRILWYWHIKRAWARRQRKADSL